VHEAWSKKKVMQQRGMHQSNSEWRSVHEAWSKKKGYAAEKDAQQQPGVGECVKGMRREIRIREDYVLQLKPYPISVLLEPS
jgi:hypothetical protein